MSIVVPAVALILLLVLSWLLARPRHRAATMAPPGWYTDPAGSGRRRWFDGRSWTSQYRDAPVAARRAA